MTAKLHEITAVLKGEKARIYSEVTALHQQAQKPDPYTGFNKTYRKKDDDGEDYSPETKRVTLVASEVLAKLAKLESKLFDITAQQEFANTGAKADLVVDNQTLLQDVPVTYLMFLDKQFTDLRTFIDKMPVLDENREWAADPNSKLVRTAPQTTHRTRKTPKVIVKYDATKEHPAQTELFTEDVVVGFWDTVHLSGALSIPRKEELLERIDKLLRAVKVAREQANDTEAPKVDAGAAIFGYLLS